MTAAQLHRLEQHDLLDLGAYADSMRDQLAAHQERFEVPIRRHQVSRAFVMNGRLAVQALWITTEGLN